MRTSLLDVNVLLGLLSHQVQGHASILDWFNREADRPFATCAVTQSAGVRLLTNPSVFTSTPSLNEAITALRRLCSHSGHQYWPDNVPFLDCIAPVSERLVGHRQVTDAYLLGLAIHRDGVLVTRDKAILFLAGTEYRNNVLVLP